MQSELGAELGLSMQVPPPAWAGRLASFDHAIFGRDSWSEAVWTDELSSSDRLYLSYSEAPEPLQSLGRVAAIAGMYFAQDCELLTVAVAKRWRRKGIAQELVSALLEEARVRGGERVFLEVRSKDEGAQALYRQLGFEPLGLRKKYYADDDALVMVAALK